MERPGIYNPIRDSNSYDFVMEVPSGRSQDRRAVSALNAVFTDLTEFVDTEISAINRAELVIPPLRKDCEIKKYTDGDRNASFFRDSPIYPHLVKRERHVYSWLTMNGLPIHAPIGEYGLSWALAITKAAQSLATLIEASEPINERCQEISIQHRKLIDAEVGWKSPRTTMKDAVHTIKATSDLFSQYIVPTFENNPLALLKQSQSFDLYNQFSLLAPLNLVVPMMSEGKVLKNLVSAQVHNGTVNLELSREVVHAFKEHKQKDGKSGKPSERKMGCPVGRANMSGLKLDGSIDENRETAISLLTPHFIAYVEYFYERRRNPLEEIIWPNVTRKSPAITSPWKLT